MSRYKLRFLEIESEYVWLKRYNRWRSAYLCTGIDSPRSSIEHYPIKPVNVTKKMHSLGLSLLFKFFGALPFHMFFMDFLEATLQFLAEFTGRRLYKRGTPVTYPSRLCIYSLTFPAWDHRNVVSPRDSSSVTVILVCGCTSFAAMTCFRPLSTFEGGKYYASVGAQSSCVYNLKKLCEQVKFCCRSRPQLFLWKFECNASVSLKWHEHTILVISWEIPVFVFLYELF